MIYIVIVALSVVLLLFLTIVPGRGKNKKWAFYGRNIAHRGLYLLDQSIPENSLPAFQRGRDAGYAMELDVQLSKDGKLVVFHDDTLERACGKQGRVDAFSFQELSEMHLFGTDERIPLFDEVLAVVDGKVPLVIEIKHGKRNKELCRKTSEMLNSYNGEYCMESFNPLIVAWFRFHMPSCFRGILSQQMDGYEEGMAKTGAFLLSRLFLNFAARPEFIAYRIGPKPFTVRLAEKLGAMPVAWTSREDGHEQDYDAVIFEHYLPAVRYKGQAILEKKKR